MNPFSLVIRDLIAVLPVEHGLVLDHDLSHPVLRCHLVLLEHPDDHAFEVVFQVWIPLEISAIARELLALLW